MSDPESAGRTRRRRAPDAVFRHRSRRSVRGDRERDRRRRRFRLAQGAAAAGAGELLEGRAAGPGAAARRRAARRRHRRLGAAGAGAAQQRGAGLRRHRHRRFCRAVGARPRHRPRASCSEIEALARELGLVVLNLDLRDTQRAAIRLYESLGYRRWGTHPCYAQVEGRDRAGPLLLQAPRRAGPSRTSRRVILFPAIDLKDGACVRLVRGEMASATVFNDDPAAQARGFAETGFCWLHVVDLDGAFAGKSVNGDAVRAIRGAVDLRIQLGGGIRDRAAIDYWLALGIDRVVLGTAALRDPELVRRAAARSSRPHRRRHRRARRPRRGRRLGRDQRDRRRRTRHALRRCRGRGDRLHRHRPRRRADRDRRGGDRRICARRSGFRSSPRAASPRSPISRRSKAHEADGIAGAICGRALYDGRLDPRAALRLPPEPLADAEDAGHPLPRRQGRAGRQGRQLCRSDRCRRPGRAGAAL